MCGIQKTFYFFVPTECRMNDTTYRAITNASPIPTKANNGHRLVPVSCTPEVTEATRSAGVVDPKKSMFFSQFIVDKTIDHHILCLNASTVYIISLSEFCTILFVGKNDSSNLSIITIAKTRPPMNKKMGE